VKIKSFIVLHGDGSASKCTKLICFNPFTAVHCINRTVNLALKCEIWNPLAWSMSKDLHQNAQNRKSVCCSLVSWPMPLNKEFALNNGLVECSGLLSNTSVQTVKRESVNHHRSVSNLRWQFMQNKTHFWLKMYYLFDKTCVQHRKLAQISNLKKWKVILVEFPLPCLARVLAESGFFNFIRVVRQWYGLWHVLSFQLINSKTKWK